MKISLITLNYNGAESAIRLLDSLKHQTDTEFSVIVADNASADVQKLRDYAAGSDIKLLENGANLGFAGGNNPALVQAFQDGSDWAVLINPDTWVKNDFIERLQAGLGSKKGIAGLPLDEGGRVAHWGIIRWLKPTLEHSYGNFRNSDSRRYAIGGGLAISRHAYETIGGLNEEYFLYFEDADYAVRARQAGLPVEFLGEPVIHHAVSEATKKLGSPLLLRYHYRNALYFNLNNGPLAIKAAAVVWSMFTAVKQFVKIVVNEHPAESRAILAGIADFYQERMGRIETGKIRVGIECEQIEGEIWGVGRIVSKLLEDIAGRSELAKTFEFHLYFKAEIPDLPFLDNPIFHKEIIAEDLPYKSFVLYYYVFLPIRLWFERLDVMFFPNYMLPIIFFGDSIAMLTEDIHYEMRSPEMTFHHRLAYRVFATWASWRATKIMAISETSKKELERLFGIEAGRIAVNRLAIDEPRPAGENRHGDYLLFVGQAFPRRHLAESLRAFELLAPDFPDLKFIVVGPDKYHPPQIRKLQKEINGRLGGERVIYHERVSQDELENLYAHALATAYISSREAFGLPPLEALAHGSVPVVADNALGHELFGEDALFVSRPFSAANIATVFREAMTNGPLREKIKGHASEITGRYTWRAHADRFLNIVRSITHHA